MDTTRSVLNGDVNWREQYGKAVRACCTYSSLVCSAHDARGCFKLENIALTSTFKIEFSAEGYEPASSEIHRDPSPAKKEWEYWFGVDLKQETLVK